MPFNYFEDQINQGKPIVPPTEAQAPVPSQAPSAGTTPPTQAAGLAVRAGGDRVFLLKDGKKFWITSPETLEKLGFTFADVVTIDQATLDVLPEGVPLR